MFCYEFWMSIITWLVKKKFSIKWLAFSYWIFSCTCRIDLIVYYSLSSPAFQAKKNFKK